MALENDVFELVNSLSKAEKKHFKQSANRFSSRKCSHYVLLFDVLTKMDEFSHATLRKKAQNIGNLPATMTQLSDMILKDLVSIEPGQTIRQKLRFMLSCIELTLERGLMRQAQKLVDKAIKLAKKHEQYLVLLEINVYRRSSRFMLAQKAPMDLLDQLPLEDAEYREQMHWEAQYLQLVERFKVRRRKWSRFRTPEQIAVLESFRENPLVNGPCKGNSLLSRIIYEEIRGKIAQASANYAIAQTHYQNISDLWKSAPHRLNDHTAWFLEQYAGLIVSSMLLEDPEAVQQGLAELRSFGIKEKAIFAKQHVNLMLFELTYLSNYGSYEAGHQHILALTALLEKHHKQISIPRKIDCYFNITIFYFLYGEFSLANTYLRKVQPLSRNGVRDDIVDFTRVFELLIQYELGNEDLLDPMFRSTYRYYSQRDKLFPYEQSILNFMKRVEDISDQKQLRLAMEEFRDAVKLVLKHTRGKRPVGSQELIFWLEARIAGIPMRDYYEQQVRTR